MMMSRVSAVLEIDRAGRLPGWSLAAPTREGPVDLVSILGEVGIDMKTVWSDVLLEGELADEPRPGDARLRELMARCRDVPVGGE